jgi:hypothetical protein
MVGDVDPPTPLAQYKDVILQEYLEYRKSHEITILSEMDPEEQGPLDTKGVWKTLFVKAMNRYEVLLSGCSISCIAVQFLYSRPRATSQSVDLFYLKLDQHLTYNLQTYTHSHVVFSIHSFTHSSNYSFIQMDLCRI